jgi:hypothetical protein
MSKKQSKKTDSKFQFDPSVQSAIMAALNALTPQQRENYQKLGESLYNSINFTTSEILDNTETPTEEMTEYIVRCIKSGLHPRDLLHEEKTHMIKHFGDEWYKDYGYESAE